ncbi:Chromo domain-containing protein 2 [Colletotrichum fructicola]|nr:Chromo domain-containing protein 2 [Colletotrichum fructicola]
MPPAISDDEQSDIGGDIIVPVKETRGKSRSVDIADDLSDTKSDLDIPKVTGDLNGSAAAANGDDDEDEDEDEDEDDDDLEADEYVVEKILDHQVGDDGLVNFRVKWEGYEKKADQTWEPEDSLKEGAAEILEEYLRAIGGREALFEQKTKAKTTKKRGRPAASSTPPATTKKSRRNGHPADSTPPASAVAAAKAKPWTLPSGSWEEDVESIDACQDEVSGALVIYLNWKNGQKTKHPTEVVYKRCPQKMLRFYEKHIRIVKSEPQADADNHFPEKTAPEAEIQLQAINHWSFGPKTTFLNGQRSELSTSPETHRHITHSTAHGARRLRFIGPVFPSVLHHPDQTLLLRRCLPMVKQNDVIAIIVIVLFIVLAGVAFGIYRLVHVARQSMSVTSGSSSSSSDEIVDD